MEKQLPSQQCALQLPASPASPLPPSILQPLAPRRTQRYLYAAATVIGWRTAFLPSGSPEYQAYCTDKPRTVFVSRRERTIVCTCGLAVQEQKLCGHVGAVLREEAR